MCLQYYVPVVPFPKTRVGVHMHFAYDMNTELPYILEMNETEWLQGHIDTVWGITGMTYKSTSILILPASLYLDEISARLALNNLIMLKT